MDEATEWVDEHRTDKPLVIVDTLEKILGTAARTHADDYKAGMLLQTLLASGGSVAVQQPQPRIS